MVECCFLVFLVCKRLLLSIRLCHYGSFSTCAFRLPFIETILVIRCIRIHYPPKLKKHIHGTGKKQIVLFSTLIYAAIIIETSLWITRLICSWSGDYKVKMEMSLGRTCLQLQKKSSRSCIRLFHRFICMHITLSSTLRTDTQYKICFAIKIILLSMPMYKLNRKSQGTLYISHH